MIKRICQHCGASFEIYPAWARKGEGKFCSRSCTASHTNRHNRLRQGPTSIEQLLMDELDQRQIHYEFQFPATGWTIDIAFPDAKLAIEADGVYWHSLKNVIEKDQRKDKNLRSNGWAVLHFDGDEIRKSPSACADKIEQYLNP